MNKQKKEEKYQKNKWIVMNLLFIQIKSGVII